jgi:propionyl-CoA carboxylase beta chain
VEALLLRKNHLCTSGKRYYAASIGLVNAIIEPRNTRLKLIRILKDLLAKKEENPPKKHGDPPF